MKAKILFLFIISFLSGISSAIHAQPVVDFSLSDSSCVGSQINITNLTTGGSTFYWNFCSGNANLDPSGINIGNPGNLLDVPTYITLVKDGNTCYSFTSCQFAGVIRYNHGTTFSHNPVSWTNLGTFGLLGDHVEGIQVKYENGNWYGFICNNSTLVRLDFGTSLANTPTAVNLNPFPQFSIAHGLEIIKFGDTWLGFGTAAFPHTFWRLNFGASLTNIPTVQDFGNFGMLITPGPICLVESNFLWYVITTTGNPELVRLSFGTSLFNTPTAENLGNPGGFNLQIGLLIYPDCDSTIGYFLNYLTDGQLGKLVFNGGITGNVTGQILGNIGNLNRPHCFSEIFREADTLYSYVTNRGSNTLTRLTFPPCTNASAPSSTLFNPPPLSYSQEGTYYVRLIVNEGMPDQTNLCKRIVIGPVPTVDLGPDRIFCHDTSIILDAGTGFTTYLWSTGATTRTITVSVTGTYSVTVTKTGCAASDAVNVSFYPIAPVNLGPDTTVCQGQTVTFDAGSCPGCSYLWTDLGTGLPVGWGQTFTTGSTGIYKVMVTNTGGCQAMDTIQLFTIPSVIVTNDPMSETICTGNTTHIILTANISGATFSWTASGSSSYVSGYSSGTGDMINQTLTNTHAINETVTYSITPSFGDCPGITADYVVTVAPILPVALSVIGSASLICPGTPVTFTATPINGGTTPHYQWNVNGMNTGPDSAVFTFAPFYNVSVYCTLTSGIQCTSGNPAPSNTVFVTCYPIVPVNLGPDTTICQGNMVTFDAGTCYGCSYVWSDLTTGQQNLGTGQTLTVADTGVYCVAITDSNGCTGRDTVQLFYYLFTPGITGNNTPCIDTLFYYYQTEPGMSNYQWNISQGGTIISGAGTNRIGVKWNDPGNQFLMVNYTIAAGCTALNPTIFPLLVYLVPGHAGNIYGPEQLCTGSPEQIYFVDSIPYAQSYVWHVPPGFQITSGQGTNTVTIAFDLSASSGDFYVYGVNLCGTGPLSPPFHFTVLQSPVVDAGRDQTILYDSTAKLSGLVTGPSGDEFSYVWEPAELLLDNTSLITETVKLTRDTLFILTATDLITGCQGMDSVRITVIHPEITEGCLVFHNVITPNGDGLNDKWIIDCIDNFPENNVAIFNRWGDKIIHFENYDNVSRVWKGTNKSGKPLPDGTYYYLLTIKNGGRYSGWIWLRGF